MEEHPQEDRDADEVTDDDRNHETARPTLGRRPAEVAALVDGAERITAAGAVAVEARRLGAAAVGRRAVVAPGQRQLAVGVGAECAAVERRRRRRQRHVDEPTRSSSSSSSWLCLRRRSPPRRGAAGGRRDVGVVQVDVVVRGERQFARRDCRPARRAVAERTAVADVARADSLHSGRRRPPRDTAAVQVGLDYHSRLVHLGGGQLASSADEHRRRGRHQPAAHVLRLRAATRVSQTESVRIGRLSLLMRRVAVASRKAAVHDRRAVRSHAHPINVDVVVVVVADAFDEVEPRRRSLVVVRVAVAVALERRRPAPVARRSSVLDAAARAALGGRPGHVRTRSGRVGDHRLDAVGREDADGGRSRRRRRSCVVDSPAERPAVAEISHVGDDVTGDEVELAVVHGRVVGERLVEGGRTCCAAGARRERRLHRVVAVRSGRRRHTVLAPLCHTDKQVSAVADGPARRAALRTSCCTHHAQCA